MSRDQGQCRLGWISPLNTLFKSLSNLMILEDVYIRDRKVRKTWRQGEIVSDSLKVVCIFHVRCSRVYILEMREGKRKAMRESGADVLWSCFCSLADL